MDEKLKQGMCVVMLHFLVAVTEPKTAISRWLLFG
jgi:hypothetical protein